LKSSFDVKKEEPKKENEKEKSTEKVVIEEVNEQLPTDKFSRILAEATKVKDQGNAFFKAGSYPEAI
jgi:hypothetical protein